MPHLETSTIPSAILPSQPPDVVLSFSGPRFDPAPQMLEALFDSLAHLGERAPGFVTGGCQGFDSLIGRYCLARWPKRKHLVILPHDSTFTRRWWDEPGLDGRNLTIRQLPFGTNYRDRNVDLVVSSAQLVAYPYAAERHPSQRRSGTWQTIRLGRRLHSRPVLMPFPRS